MKISTKGRYGVQIMTDIAAHCSKPVKISEICARQGITVKYAEQLTAILIKGNLLRSVRGASGGYELTKPAAEYTMDEIINVLEGDFLPVGCLTSPCAKKENCGMFRFWQGLYDSYNSYLKSKTLQDLIEEGSSADFYSI